jgi:hypothetical protein
LSGFWGHEENETKRLDLVEELVNQEFFPEDRIGHAPTEPHISHLRDLILVKQKPTHC